MNKLNADKEAASGDAGDRREPIGLMEPVKLSEGARQRGILTDRQARRVVSALIDREVIVSKTTRPPLRLAFPAALAHEWMPGLFPEKTSS